MTVEVASTEPVNLIANGDFEASDTQVPSWTIKASRVGFCLIKSGVGGNDTNTSSLSNGGAAKAAPLFCRQQHFCFYVRALCRFVCGWKPNIYGLWNR